MNNTTASAAALTELAVSLWSLHGAEKALTLIPSDLSKTAARWVESQIRQRAWIR